MKAYFEVAIAQHIERANQLLEQIDDSEVPQEYFVLSRQCREEVVKVKEELQALQDNQVLQHPDLQKVRLRRFRRAVDRISKIETTGVVALSRRHKEDIFLTRLVRQIRQEIKYPFLPPVVTGLSTNYFYIHNDLQLMFVPLIEGNFLLHLPDLYHELAHPLLFDIHSPRVKALNHAASMAWALAAEHLDKEMIIEERRQGPIEFLMYFRLWQKSWRFWAIEFICDLFAIFTLGPAFAWAHIHLCMKNEHDPYFVPTRSVSTHPADNTRMRVMIMGLEKIGFNSDSSTIKDRWDEYLELSEAQITGNYKRCFPDALLQKIVDLAYEGVIQTSCRIVTHDTSDPVHVALNNAWVHFWDDPSNYISWEKEKINELRELCRDSISTMFG